MSSTAIAIFGPTATGKSALALEVAAELGYEILSADSRQVFRGLDIGTAKVSLEERRGIVHHGIDIVGPDESFSTGDFRRYAEDVLDSGVQRSVGSVIVGGTGLYIQSLLNDFIVEDESNNENNEKKRLASTLQQRRLNGEADLLYAELMKVDPTSAMKYSDRNPRRIDRALTFFAMHGYPLSQAQSLASVPRRDDIMLFVMEQDADTNASTIRDRVHQMWDAGFENEVRTLLSSGIPPTAQSMATVGYREMIRYLEGELDASEAIERMIISTRQYAKRQRTWGRHQFATAYRINGSMQQMKDSLLQTYSTMKG